MGLKPKPVASPPPRAQAPSSFAPMTRPVMSFAPKPAPEKELIAKTTRPAVGVQPPASAKVPTIPQAPTSAKPAAGVRPAASARPAAGAKPSAGLVFESLEAAGPSSDNLVMQARAHHFEVEQKGERRPQVFPAPHRELPAEYGETLLALMARDPEWVFAYWEVAQRDRERYNVGEGSLTLRLYDVSGIEFTGANALAYYDTTVGSATNWYLRLPATERHWVADLGVIARDGKFVTIARSNVVSPPRNNVSPLDPEEEWMTVETDFERIFELSGGRVARGGASEQAAAKKRVQFEWPRLEMGSEALASGALMKAGGFAAPGRGFRLVVNAELIIYGATEPDARVTIQGHPLRLNPDGTFRLRLALPDGSQEIPVKAVRSDGEEEREITPIVTRETRGSNGK